MKEQKIRTFGLPCAKCNLAMHIRYPSRVICLDRENRPTSASSTLLLAVAPPAQSTPLRQYEDIFELQMLLVKDNVPELDGPQRLKAAFQNFINATSGGTFSIDNRPPRLGSRKASNARHRSNVGPFIVLKVFSRVRPQIGDLRICCNWTASISVGKRVRNL